MSKFFFSFFFAVQRCRRVVDGKEGLVEDPNWVVGVQKTCRRESTIASDLQAPNQLARRPPLSMGTNRSRAHHTARARTGVELGKCVRNSEKWSKTTNVEVAEPSVMSRAAGTPGARPGPVSWPLKLSGEDTVPGSAATSRSHEARSTARMVSATCLGGEQSAFGE